MTGSVRDRRRKEIIFSGISNKEHTLRLSEEEHPGSRTAVPCGGGGAGAWGAGGERVSRCAGAEGSGEWEGLGLGGGTGVTGRRSEGGA